jgi:hypothetical protein
MMKKSTLRRQLQEDQIDDFNSQLIESKGLLYEKRSKELAYWR